MAAEEPGLISISACIDELRQELTYALASGEAGRLRFALGPVDMELSVLILREGSGKGGVRLWVVSGGGELPRGTTLQKIKLNLQPQQVEPEEIADPTSGDELTSNKQSGNSVIVNATQVRDELESRYSVQWKDYS